MSDPAEPKRRERGSGSLFREFYRDPRTGERRQMSTFSMKVWHHGKALKKSSGETTPYRANKALEKWKEELAAGTYVPDADKTTFKTLSMMLLDEYKANARRSTERVADAVAHLRGFSRTSPPRAPSPRTGYSPTCAGGRRRARRTQRSTGSSPRSSGCSRSA